jgi:hypothetical protein
VAQGFHNQPDDYFSSMGARYYMYDDKEGLETAEVVRNVTRAIKAGNDNVTVTVYRAVPSDVGNTKLKNGDWIALSKSYAEIHGEENLNGEYKIIEQEVPVNEVWWDGNDIREWGYDNGKEQLPDLYLSIQNPKYQDELPTDWNEARKLRDEGFDGVITPDNRYMVFEKTQIKSVDNQGTFDESNPNIYYQKSDKNIVDLTNEFDKTPTIEEVKQYINETIEKGTKFATLSSDWFVDIKKENSNRKQKRITDKLLNTKNFKNLSKQEQKRQRKYIMSLEKMLSNAEYIGAKDNTKVDKKPNVEKYHYFRTNVKIGEKTYSIIFDTEEYKNNLPESDYVETRSFKNPQGDTNNINDNSKNFNSKTVHLYNITEYKTRYQDGETDYKGYFQTKEEEKRIAGFTYEEVLNKLTELNEKLFDIENNKTKSNTDLRNKIMAEIHVLEDSFDISENRDKYKNEDRIHETMLNAYYIMNNQEIPKEYIESDTASQRSYKDLADMHNKRKEELENKYYDYYKNSTQEVKIVTIMANKDASTALHEFGHVYLDLLEELAKVNDDAKQQLEAVQKWLGYSGEWTSAQHEKFAGTFVAYLYKGKAPTNKLRKAFESFKEWLKTVYHSVLDIPDVEISDEVQELFDNIFGEDSYYQERKAATQLFHKIKIASRKDKLKKVSVLGDKKLTKGQKRCKNVCYDILSVATGKDVNYLKRIFETDSNKNGYTRRREVVEELLDKADDKITISGGMKQEWQEFFSDTGVNYNNEEVGGDYELAQKALDVIINKSYWDSEQTDRDVNSQLGNQAIYIERVINNSAREYKMLLDAFKNGNRNIALAAGYEWIESLPAQIKEDYADKFSYDTSMIERNENINKFDKAKRAILSKALELENEYSINTNEGYKQLVQEVFKDLNFLQPSDKAKLTANILDVPSVQFLMSSIDNIMDIAKTMEDVNFRRNLEKEIHKELQGTKNIKKNGRSVGKYDYHTNKIFEELRSLDKLSPEKANELRLETRRFAEAEDNGLSASEKLINKFLSYKAGGRTFNDTDLIKDLYDEIVKVKLIGKGAKSELDLQEKLSEEQDVDELINIVNSKKDANIILKGYINGVANLESTVNAIFNKDIKEKYAAEILYAETQAQAWQHEQKQNFEKEVAKIYNLPQWCWDKKIIEYLGKKYTYPELRRKYDENGELTKTRIINRTLTKMDIIQAYIWDKNEVLGKRLLFQFGDEVKETMFNELSDEDKKFADLMMRTAQSFYPLVNKAFINKYGIDLPQVSCYFPSTPERGSEIDLYNDYSSKSLGNGFTKSRAMSELIPMDFHNPVATLYSHIDGVAKFVFMSESLDKANLRFRNTDLKRAIINKFGEDAYRTLEQSLINVTYKKEAPVFNGMNKVLDNMIGNWIQANVAVKPIVGLKQLLSANNYAVDMPYMTWQVGFLKALTDFKGTIDYMMKIPYIKARYEGNFSNEFLKQTIENSAFATSKKLKDLCTLFVKIGDIGAIMFGGKPYIDYLITEKGMSENEAIKQFILSTNRSQQSSAVSSLSNFQVNMTRNPVGKLFIAFKNSPQQYVRMCGDAIVSMSNGDISKTQCAKMLFQFGYLQPFLYAIATSGSLFRFLFTGDDDDLKKDATMSIFDLNSNALPFFGDLYKYALERLAYKEKYMPQSTPLVGDIQQEINKISKDDATLEDYLEAIGYVGLHVGLGYNSKAIHNMGAGAVDVATGNVVEGSMKVLGYTDKRSKHIAGNEKKKKK